MDTDYSALIDELREAARSYEANHIYEGAEMAHRAADALVALTTERTITDEDCAIALIAWRNKDHELAGYKPRPEMEEEKDPSAWGNDSIAKMRAALEAALNTREG